MGRVFFSKNMVSKHFWTLFPFPVAKFLNIWFVKSTSAFMGVFFSKNMVSKHFWTLFPFPVANFLNIWFVKSTSAFIGCFFQKTWLPCIFGPYFRFLLPNFSTSGSSNQHRPLSGASNHLSGILLL